MSRIYEIRGEILSAIECGGSAHSQLTKQQLIAVADAVGCDTELGLLLDNTELRIRIRCAVGVADSVDGAGDSEFVKEELETIRSVVTGSMDL